MNSQIFSKSGVSFLKLTFPRGEEENSRRSCSPSGGRSNFLDFFGYFLGRCQKVTNHISGDFSFHQLVKMQKSKKMETTALLKIRYQ